MRFSIYTLHITQYTFCPLSNTFLIIYEIQITKCRRVFYIGRCVVGPLSTGHTDVFDKHARTSDLTDTTYTTRHTGTDARHAHIDIEPTGAEGQHANADVSIGHVRTADTAIAHEHTVFEAIHADTDARHADSYARRTCTRHADANELAHAGKFDTANAVRANANWHVARYLCSADGHTKWAADARQIERQYHSPFR